MNLYQITNEYLRAFDELSQVDGLDHDMIKDSLASIEHDFDQKALNVAAYIKNLEFEVVAMKEYEKRMSEKREKAENKIKRLREYIKMNLDACDKKKIDGPEFSIYIKNNPPRVICENLDEIPNEWFITETVKNLDKEAIKCALQEGLTIKGARLEQDTSLVIK